MPSNFPLTLGSDYADPYAAQIEAMRRKLAQPAAPMYTPEQVAQLRAENNKQFQLGMLGQLSGDEALGNVGAQVFKQALANRQKRVTDKGTADPLTGEFTYSPDYLREKDETALAGLENRSAATRANWESGRQAAAERRELAQQRAADQRALRSMMGGSGQGAGGSFTPAGFTPQGKQVVTNSKSGISYVLTLGPDGTPSYEPYQGSFTPKAQFEKQVTDVNEQLGAAKRAQDLLTTVQENPDAFGVTAAAVGALPGWSQGWVAKATNLTPQQLQTRAMVTREAAMELNRIYGAAQSAGELARAAAWAPNASDDLGAILNKLQSARDWAVSNAAMQGPAAIKAVTERSPTLQGVGQIATGGGTAPAAAGGGGWGMRKVSP